VTMLDRFRALRARMWSMLTDARDEREFDQELEAHLDLAIDEYVRRGMTVDKARRLAIVRLGGLQQARETHRDARGLSIVDRIVQDLRFTRRALVREPWFTVTAVLILAIGIGANTAIFGLVRAVILQPAVRGAGAPGVDRQRQIGPFAGRALGGHADGRRVGLLAAPFTPVRGHYGVQRLFCLRQLSADRQRRTVTARRRAGFPQLPVGPGCGAAHRPLLQRERDAAGRSARDCPQPRIVAASVCQRSFGCRPKCRHRRQGRDCRRSPAPFDFSSVFSPATRVDFLSPLVFEEVRTWGNTVSIVGRLHGDSTLASAQQEIDALSARFKREEKSLLIEFEGGLSPLSDEVSGRTRRAVLLLWTAVGIVLLIACGNLSSLLLTRASGRRHEFVVRAALGATRGRLIALLLTESLVLAGVGAILGIAGAHVIFTRLSMLENLAIPLVQRSGLDAFVMAFTATVTIATAALVGIWPGLTASRVDVNEALKAGARGMSWPRIPGGDGHSASEGT
jgi:hypothetical protein